MFVEKIESNSNEFSGLYKIIAYRTYGLKVLMICQDALHHSNRNEYTDRKERQR